MNQQIKNEWVDEETLETAVCAVCESCEVIAAVKRTDGLRPSSREVFAAFDALPSDAFDDEAFAAVPKPLLQAIVVATLAAASAAEIRSGAERDKWVPTESQVKALARYLAEADAAKSS